MKPYWPASAPTGGVWAYSSITASMAVTAMSRGAHSCVSALGERLHHGRKVTSHLLTVAFLLLGGQVIVNRIYLPGPLCDEVRRDDQRAIGLQLRLRVPVPLQMRPPLVLDPRERSDDRQSVV